MIEMVPVQAGISAGAACAAGPVIASTPAAQTAAAAEAKSERKWSLPGERRRSDRRQSTALMRVCQQPALLLARDRAHLGRTP
ncbi:hypothetical protein ACPPVO_50480 [Dactylosporangium sp. McL0621]|uniref:hypothetical protein n=1 Tax=Dactylosporangium sp. McL0621 TaxID=3415678 RepID=UPI003CF5A040